MTDMTPAAVHEATLQKLYAALQHSITLGDAVLINALSSAIQRLKF